MSNAKRKYFCMHIYFIVLFFKRNEYIFQIKFIILLFMNFLNDRLFYF